MKLFSYGSLVLPDYLEKFNGKLLTKGFLRGYKIKCELSPITSNGYHYLSIYPTGNNKDIVTGFILDIPEDRISMVDNFEGKSFKRIETIVYNSYLHETSCYVYINNT